jgi:transposase
MAKIHENAALTITQRKLIRNLYLEGASISSLARRFGVNRKTAQRWAKRESPYDVPSGAKTPRSVITNEYRQAVVEHRQANPDHGAITIAFYLKQEFPFAKKGTVQKILNQEALSKPKPKGSEAPKN